MQQSLWHSTIQKKHHNLLQNDIKTDILIIGGGICGILCAYFLKQEGIDYILTEANEICSGNTGNTTAKITSQHGLIYHKLLSCSGKEKAALYLDANQNALNQYRKLAEKIDCNFEEKYAGVYSLDNRQIIEQETAALNQLGIPAVFSEHPALPFPVKGAVLFPGQAQFHPLKFLFRLSENLNIYEHTFIRKIDGHTAYTDHGNITADKIIVTSHFPFLNKRGSYFLKLYQSRSYVIALKDADNVNGMYIDADKNGLSFRNYKDLLLVGGGGGRTGRHHGNWQMLREFSSSAYPAAKEVSHWAAQDCISLDHIPYIGKYSANTPYLYTATGFNKWGMTTSMVAAMLLRDLVLERENPYQEIFSPSRSILKPQLFINGLESTVNLLTPSFRRCPHLGCALKWNPIEHSWDCPCHGSRFQTDGKLIDNPSVKNY